MENNFFDVLPELERMGLGGNLMNSAFQNTISSGDRRLGNSFKGLSLTGLAPGQAAPNSSTMSYKEKLAKALRIGEVARPAAGSANTVASSPDTLMALIQAILAGTAGGSPVAPIAPPPGDANPTNAQTGPGFTEPLPVGNGSGPAPQGGLLPGLSGLLPTPTSTPSASSPGSSSGQVTPTPQVPAGSNGGMARPTQLASGGGSSGSPSGSGLQRSGILSQDPIDRIISMMRR